MNHGITDLFAFQEAILIEAVFGVALLTMLWVGFRRWLQYKERMGRLTAEQAAQYRTDMEGVEARLQAVEQIVAGGGAHVAGQIDGLGSSALGEAIAKPMKPHPAKAATAKEG